MPVVWMLPETLLSSPMVILPALGRSAYRWHFLPPLSETVTSVALAAPNVASKNAAVMAVRNLVFMLASPCSWRNSSVTHPTRLRQGPM